MFTILTPFRHLIQLSEEWKSFLTKRGYTPASDGIWMPCCDIRQYEAGNRKPIK